MSFLILSPNDSALITVSTAAFTSLVANVYRCGSRFSQQLRSTINNEVKNR
jgi:hypothetical protein